MTAQKNIEAVQKMYAAFGRGDIPAILEYVADDIDWGIQAQSSKEVPWHGTGRGRDFAVAFFQALGQNADFPRFEPSGFLGDDHAVSALISFDVVLKKNGKKASYEVCHHFTFKNGKVVKWRGWEDTAHTKALWNS